MFLLGGDGRVLVLMQGFLDFLFDLEWAVSSVAAVTMIFGKSGTWAVQPLCESVQSTEYGRDSLRKCCIACYWLSSIYSSEGHTAKREKHLTRFMAKVRERI